MFFERDIVLGLAMSLLNLALLRLSSTFNGAVASWVRALLLILLIDVHSNFSGILRFGFVRGLSGWKRAGQLQRRGTDRN